MGKKFAVIGLGNFGSYLTKALFKDGNDVIAVDMDEDRVQKIQPFCSQAIVGDATDKDMLKTIGLEEMETVIVCMGGNANAATLITLYLKEFGTKRVYVKATNEDHGRILSKVGASHIIYPEKDMAVKVAKRLSTPDVLDYIPMSGEYIIAEIDKVDALIGRTLAELELRSKYNVNVIGIKQGEPEKFILVPRADFKIKNGDVLLVIGTKEDIEKIKNLKIE